MSVAEWTLVAASAAAGGSLVVAGIVGYHLAATWAWRRRVARDNAAPVVPLNRADRRARDKREAARARAR